MLFVQTFDFEIFVAQTFVIKFQNAIRIWAEVSLTGCGSNKRLEQRKIRQKNSIFN